MVPSYLDPIKPLNIKYVWPLHDKINKTNSMLLIANIPSPIARDIKEAAIIRTILSFVLWSKVVSFSGFKKTGSDNG